MNDNTKALQGDASPVADDDPKARAFFVRQARAPVRRLPHIVPGDPSRRLRSAFRKGCTAL